MLSMKKLLFGLCVGIGASFAPSAVAEDKKDDDGWVQLFNGKDFTGWKMVNPPSGEFESVTEQKNDEGKIIAFVGKTKPKKAKDGTETPGKEITLWQIKDGAIVGGGPASHLFSERGDYTDFEYRIEAKINDKGNSGQYIRTEFGPGFPKGYEIQINATHGDAVKSGSLYPANGIDRDEKHLVRKANHNPDEWFTQEVIAVGPKITIMTNGKTMVDYTIPGDKYFTKGHFALQAHDPGSIMSFKKIAVKEIKK